MKTTTYSTVWRNKWLTSEAQSLDDMIENLKEAISDLEDMKQAGVEANFEGAADDYVYLTTYDRKLAKKFGFGIE